MEIEQQKDFRTPYGSEETSSGNVRGTTSPLPETGGNGSCTATTPQQETTDESVSLQPQHCTVQGDHMRTVNQVINNHNNDATEESPLLNSQQLRIRLKKRLLMGTGIFIVTILLAILVAAVAPVTLHFVQTPIQPRNITLFAVDPDDNHTFWLTNITQWYKSIGISRFSNTTGENTFDVYTIPQRKLLDNTFLNSSLTCMDKTIIVGNVPSIYPPRYNISLQKHYLFAGSQFTQTVCVNSPSQPIELGLHLFQISYGADYDTYLNFINHGNLASTVLSSTTKIHLTQIGCVQLNMTIPQTTFYYTATSVSNLQGSNTLVLFTMTCNLSLQTRSIDATKGHFCTTNGSDQCMIPIPGSDMFFNTNPQNIAVLLGISTNMTSTEIQITAINNMNDICHAIILGIAFIGLVILTVVAIVGCFYLCQHHVPIEQ